MKEIFLFRIKLYTVLLSMSKAFNLHASASGSKPSIWYKASAVNETE
jgi:hypothetical protein